jgi:hypothetical protein
MATVVSKDGTTIAFDKYGAGSPIVLVCGAFQYRAFDPRTTRMAKSLSARFTVYPDLGHESGLALVAGR